MRKLAREFRAFATSGNMLDLALGFIIGTAFAALVQSLAKNILMQLVAAVAGQPDYSNLTIGVGASEIRYGTFLTDLLNFGILTAVLFFVVKMISWLGLAKGRVFGDKDCPYCQEKVAVNALICKFCRQPLVEELPSLAEAQARLDAQRSRRLPLPPLAVPPRVRPRLRRRGSADPLTSGDDDDATAARPEAVPSNDDATAARPEAVPSNDDATAARPEAVPSDAVRPGSARDGAAGARADVPPGTESPPSTTAPTDPPPATPAPTDPPPSVR